MKSLSFLVGVLFLLLVGAMSAQAFTLYTKVTGPGGFDSGYISQLTLDCSDRGIYSTPTGSWGSYNDCQTVGTSGTYYWNYGMTAFTCPGPGVTTVDPGTETRGAVVDFCPKNGSGSCPVAMASYCDLDQPSTAAISDSPSWFRDDFSIALSFDDAYHAYTIETQQRITGGSYDTYTLDQTCGSAASPTTTCSGTATVQVSAATCSQTGTGRCEVQARFSDYWDNFITDTETYNIDRIDPSSSSSFTRVREYNDGSIDWFRDSVTVQVDAVDTTSTADQSGVNFIYIEARGDASCSGPGSAYTTYDVNGLSTSVQETFSSTTNEPIVFCYYSEDNSLTTSSTQGNVEAVANTATNVWIDGVDPTIAITPKPNVWLDGYTLDITSTCTDPGGSECGLIHYDRNNFASNVQTCSNYDTAIAVAGTPASTTISDYAAYCIPGDTCEFRFCAYSEDNVGNTGGTDSWVYSIDRTLPTGRPFTYNQFPSYSTSPLLSASNDSWFNRSFQVTATFDDTGSGIGDCEYRVYDNGAISRDWTDANCPAGDDTVGVDTDLTGITGTFTVTVGAGADCETEGRDTCRIEVRAADMVGNTMAPIGETVSIDYSAPSCSVTTIDPLTNPTYQYYDVPTNTYTYNNNPNIFGYDGSGTYEVVIGFDDTKGGALADQDVSGVRITTFPSLTGTATPLTETLEMGPVPFVTHHPQYSRTVAYSYDNTSTFDSVAPTVTAPSPIVIVEDEAGNIDTCTFDVDRVDGSNPPPVDANITYDHIAIDGDLFDIADPNLNISINATPAVPSRPIEGAQLRLIKTNGTSSGAGGDHIPICTAFDTSDLHNATWPVIADRAGLFAGYPDTLNATELANLNTLIDVSPGECLLPYILVYDEVWDTTAAIPADTTRVIATDDSTTTASAQLACGFYGLFDNCNNRSSYVNGVPVDQFLTGRCDGSCRTGLLEIQRNTGAEVHPNGQVSILGIDRDGYSDRTNASGRYELYNISAEPQRSFTIEGSPRLQDSIFYSAQSRTLTLDSTPINASNGEFPEVGTSNFLLGFRSSECTSACTLSTDPGVGSCRLDCAGFNGCLDPDGDTNYDTSSDEYQALQACDGLSRGFVTTESGRVFNCCTTFQGTTTDIGSVSASFEVNASDIVRQERLVYYGGKLVKLVVITFEPE